MRFLKPRELRRYGVAFLSVALLLAIKLALDRAFVGMRETPFLLAFGAIIVSAWYGGRGPGMFATVLSGIAVQFFFLGPRDSLLRSSWESNFKLGLFLLEGTLISQLCGALQESRARTRAVLETATDGVITMDHHGRIVDFNGTAERIFGRLREDVIGLDMAELIVPEQLREQHRAGLQRYLATGHGPVLGRRIELRALRADGTEFPVELSIARILSDGPPIFTGFVRDVSDRQRTEAIAHKSEERFRATVESSPMAMVMVDVAGVIVLVNSETEKLFGYRREELLGRKVELLLPQRFRGQHPEFRADYFADPQARRTGAGLDLNGLRKDGSEFPVEIGLNPVRTNEGVFVLSAIVDITERKRAEQELREAKDVAETANRAKSEFLANVSHELRTPMNAVLGMLQLALSDKLTPAMRDNLRTAQDSAESLMALLNDILDFSRIEAGKFVLEAAPFSLRDTLAAAMRTLSMRAYEKGLELACRVDSDVPDKLWGDGRRLRQVVLNLAGNALKFTEQGEVVVNVSVESLWIAEPEISRNALASGLCVANSTEPDASAFRLINNVPTDPSAHKPDSQPRHEILLHLTVSDTGIGIAPEEHSQIFEPFTQVDALSTRAHGGAGLGLAICRELLELMGGRIWVDSELGHGSRFHGLAQFQVEMFEPIVDASRQALLADLLGMPVLIVDNHPTSRHIVEEMLNRWEMQPISACDGQTALSVLRDAAYNGSDFPLVISDMRMPDMDGITLAEQIRQDESLDAAVILLLPATQRQSFAERLRNLHIAAYLEKPVTQSDLLDAILIAMHEPLFGESTVEQMAGIPRVLRVLVAEDTIANQKVVRAILTQRGHTVEIVGNGREALDHVQRDQFDVVLMDVQMPTMDGLQATAAIRRLGSPAMQSLPIIAMTAHAMPGDRDRCLAAGMTDYLAKPIDTFQLINLIERLATNPVNTAEPSGNLNVSAATEADVAANLQPLEFNVPDPVHIDRDAALKRLGGNEQLYRSLVQFFSEDSPGLLEDIRNGLRTGDREQVARAAHSLKGLAANFGCETAIKAAMRMQEIGTSGSLEEATSTLATLTDAILKLNLILVPDGAVHGPA